MNRDVLTRLLVRRGWKVLAAIDGRKGIEDAIAHRPDLILMDMSLPEIDGWTAAATLKRDARTARIPIVALRAHAMGGDRERSLEAGCDEFETKPVELARLLAKMNALSGPRCGNGGQ